MVAINFPDFPTLNQVFNDPVSGRYWRWDGEKWLSFDAGLSDTASLSLSEVPPLFTEPGDLWFESDTTRFFVYFDGAWVEIQGGNPGIQGPEGPAGNTPSGVINQYAGVSAPTGWLLCQGQLLNRLDYPSLFDVLQTAYNTGGETTAQFRLPNLKGSVPVGLDESQTEFNAMGKRGGSKISTAPHTHSTSHSHTASSSASTSITSGGSHVHRVANNITLVNTGTTFGAPNRTGTGEGWDTESSGSHSHTASTTVSTTVNAPNTTTSGDSSATLTSGNLQPYITLNYIIKI